MGIFVEKERGERAECTKFVLWNAAVVCHFTGMATRFLVMSRGYRFLSSSSPLCPLFLSSVRQTLYCLSACLVCVHFDPFSLLEWVLHWNYQFVQQLCPHRQCVRPGSVHFPNLIKWMYANVVWGCVKGGSVNTQLRCALYLLGRYFASDTLWQVQ